MWRGGRQGDISSIETLHLLLPGRPLVLWTGRRVHQAIRPLPPPAPCACSAQDCRLYIPPGPHSQTVMPNCPVKEGTCGWKHGRFQGTGGPHGKGPAPPQTIGRGEGAHEG